MIQISTETEACNLGLKYKYKLTPDRTAPLIYLVHGRAGTYDVMWTFARCIPEHFNVIAPEAFIPDPVGGFSWWPIDGNKDRSRIDSAAAKLRAFVAAAEQAYGLAPTARLALGFSQGAGLLSCLVQTEPALLEKAGLLAGFVIDCGGPAGGKPLPSIFMAHGTQDPVIPLDKAREGADILRGYGATVEFHEDDVTHKVGTTGMRALKEWLARG